MMMVNDNHSSVASYTQERIQSEMRYTTDNTNYGIFMMNSKKYDRSLLFLYL